MGKQPEVAMNINILVNGVIHVTGEHDTGKTSFALECGAQPGAICFLDDDVKGRATVMKFMRDGNQFGAYHDLADISNGKTELQFHDACMSIIDGIKPGQYEAIVWDTWTRFQKTLHPYVLANKTKFRSTWSAMGKIKGAQEWSTAQDYEAAILNRLQKLAQVVFVVTHLKDHYEGEVKVPGKYEPASSRTMNRVPVLRLWLRQNPDSAVPIGLVLKRTDVKRPTPRGIRTVSVLPRKIVPAPSDESLWDTIRSYYENPVGLRELTPNEIPDAYELSILDGTLTADQRHTFELMLRAGVLEVEPNDELTVTKDKVDEQKQALLSQGKVASPAVLADILGVTVPEILQLLQDGEG